MVVISELSIMLFLGKVGLNRLKSLVLLNVGRYDLGFIICLLFLRYLPNKIIVTILRIFEKLLFKK